MDGKCCQKMFDLRKIPRKHFVARFMGENPLRNSSEIFRFGKCCPFREMLSVSGNVSLRFYDFASSENVQEMRRNREPHRCTSALLQAASRILTREQSFIFLKIHYSSRAMLLCKWWRQIQHSSVKVDITALVR